MVYLFYGRSHMMTFLHKGFDEIRRLGLRSETEQVVRHASPTGETGMLVVDSVVPSGPADKHLEPGDVLVRVNGTVLTQFLNLENLQEVKKQQSLSHSPKTKTSGFTVAIGQGSPSDSPGTNRWFKPEIDAPSAIRSIQIEEKAMKDLRRFYSSVKVVRNQP